MILIIVMLFTCSNNSLAQCHLSPFFPTNITQTLPMFTVETGRLAEADVADPADQTEEERIGTRLSMPPSEPPAPEVTREVYLDGFKARIEIFIASFVRLFYTRYSRSPNYCNKFASVDVRGRELYGRNNEFTIIKRKNGDCFKSLLNTSVFCIHPYHIDIRQ